jgi:hypothetical protein
MLVSDVGFEPNDLLAIVPIEELYTLYVDTEHRLRYLGHRGADNIENQPLLPGVEALNLSPDERVPRGVRARFKPLKQPEWMLQAGAHLAPASPFTFALNRP